MVTRLRVKNFKSIRDLDLRLEPINVLVGPNMAGKSNILDVLWFIHDILVGGRGQGLNFALTQRGGINELLWKGGKEKVVTLGLDTTGDPLQSDTSFRYELQLLAGPGGYVSVHHESLKLIRSGIEHELLELQPSGGFTQFRNVEGQNLGGVGTSGATALENAFSTWDGYSFCEMIKQWRFYHFVPRSMKEPSKMVSGEILDEPGGDNLSAWLMWLQTHSPDVFAKINEVLRDVMPGLRQVKTIPTADGNVHLSISEKGLSQPTSVWQASDGFLALTALLSLIYVPRDRGATLYCVEETENHLHPRMLETLVTLLRQVTQETQDSNTSRTQFLFTTQSPYFLDQFEIDEVLWVEKENGETKVSRPADKEHLRRLVEDKDRGLGDLMYSGALGND